MSYLSFYTTKQFVFFIETKLGLQSPFFYNYSILAFTWRTAQSLVRNNIWTNIVSSDYGYPHSSPPRFVVLYWNSLVSRFVIIRFKLLEFFLHGVLSVVPLVSHSVLCARSTCSSLSTLWLVSGSGESTWLRLGSMSQLTARIVPHCSHAFVIHTVRILHQRLSSVQVYTSLLTSWLGWLCLFYSRLLATGQRNCSVLFHMLLRVYCWITTELKIQFMVGLLYLQSV